MTEEDYASRKKKIQDAIELEGRNDTVDRIESISADPYENLRAIPYSNQHRTRVVMSRVEQPPPYSAWIPVRKCYVMDTIEDAYIPYFGEKEEDCAKALGAFDKMLTSVNADTPFDLLSDGELSESGFFHLPKGESSMTEKGYLTKLLLRAVQRIVILKIVTIYGRKEYVWVALKKAMGLPTTRHVQVIFELASKRKAKTNDIKQKCERSRNYARGIRNAFHHPLSSSSEQDLNHNVTNNTLKYFCFVCHEFCCDVHDVVRLVPRQPIPERRRKGISRLQTCELQPCSRTCYLLPKWNQSPLGPDENQVWTTEEGQLLTEALAFLQPEPCLIASVVGSKSCREVWKKLSDPKEQAWIRRATDTDAHYKAIFDENRRFAARVNVETDSETTDDEFTIENTSPIKREIKKKRKKSTQLKNKKSIGAARKSSISVSSPQDGDEEDDEAAGNISFIPCDHEGKCSKNKDCRCLQESVICQPTCACNAIRYSEEYGDIVRVGEDCSNTQDGCDCDEGPCNNEKCRCFTLNQVACNPDECDCDCRIPPWEISVRERKCKNVDIIIHRHKRTYIGRSPVEGFGLFAGEHFEKGELVGEYVGGQWQFDKVDSVLAVGDVKERTYAYDVRNVTIDGTMFGAKIKFVNCSVDKRTQNCTPILVCVKGHWHLRLITKRPVEPGTEFLFDYGLNGKKDYQWLQKAREAVRESTLKHSN